MKGKGVENKNTGSGFVLASADYADLGLFCLLRARGNNIHAHVGSSLW